MKKIISVLFVLALAGAMAFAQPAGKKGGEEAWQERMKIEKISYLSSELSLTSEEAQVFWPVWNEVQGKRQEAFKASGEAFKALQEGVNGPDAAKLLNAYVDAKDAASKINAEALARFKQVLPVEKVAKLLVAEETFRRNQIGKLGGKGGSHGGHGGHGGKGGSGGHGGSGGPNGPRGGFGGGNAPMDAE